MARFASCTVAAGTASDNDAAGARNRCHKTRWNLLGVKLW